MGRLALSFKVARLSVHYLRKCRASLIERLPTSIEGRLARLLLQNRYLLPSTTSSPVNGTLVNSFQLLKL